MIFKDRFEAGRELAKKLAHYKNNPEAIILAIPRGGLQLGYALAKELNLKQDIILTKKISHPTNSEYAIGAVSLNGEVVDESLLRTGEVSLEYVSREVKKIRKKLRQRYREYLGRKNSINLKNKIVILTDDGIATGKTLLAAIDLIRKDQPKKVIVAVPVAPPDAFKKIKEKADEVICLMIPSMFFAVSEFYQNFPQVEDKEAIKLLKEVN